MRQKQQPQPTLEMSLWFFPPIPLTRRTSLTIPAIRIDARRRLLCRQARQGLAVVFTPQSVGSLSAGITLTNNALNVTGNTQQVSVSGTAFSGADTTLTTVTVIPTSLANGQAASHYGNGGRSNPQRHPSRQAP